MKIDWKAKQTKVIAGILAVIIIPILYNQCKTIKNKLITAYAMSQPKVVQVANPLSKDIMPSFKTSGRIEAKSSIDVVARVSGWLLEQYFSEGQHVKKGQKLFLIEPSEYALAAKNASATVSESTAVYKNSQINYHRAQELLKQDLVSREYYDNALTERNKSRAALDGAVAELSKAKLDLSYTKVTSPMDGRIGKLNISVGNYVTPNAGAITQIYSTNPMRVVFSVKSSNFIEIKKYRKNNQDKGTISVLLELADGSIYEHEGEIEYVDNKIDETTGTVNMRALFKNPDELLVHGDYANVILRLNKKEKVMLIPQSATLTDVGTGYYVWTVDKDNKAVKKNIVVSDNIDNYWVVDSGLSYDDVVVMQGIQNIYKTGQKVKTQPYEVKNEEKGQNK